MGSTPELYTRLPSSTKEFLIPWDVLDKHYEGTPWNAYHDSIDMKFVDYAGNVSTIRSWPQRDWEGRSLESDGYLDAYPYEALHDQVDLEGYLAADDDFIGIYDTYAEKGDTLVVKTTATTHVITAKHGTGNLRLIGFGDLVMTPGETYLVFTYDGVDTWVQVGETVSGGGTGNGLSGVIVGTNGDYATIAAALAASETVIILDEGTHTITGSSETVPRGTTIMGQGIDKSIITCSDATATLIVEEGAILQDLTVENTYASALAAVSSPYWVTYSDYVEMYRVKIEATAGTADAFVTDTETRLHDCILISAGGYGLSAENDSDVEIYGGWIEGSTTDIEAISGCDVRFYNVPKLTNGAVTGTGALHGWFQDAAGELFGHDDPLLDMVELASDPGTPDSGRWNLYFKSGGAYIIDDTGTVTGPLGGGGGSGWPFSGNVLTVDTTDSDADYSTLSAAIAAASAGDVILMSAESHSCVNQELPAGVHLVGQGMGATILACTGNIWSLKVRNGSILMNFTLQQNSTHSPAYGPYMTTAGETSQFINVEVDCNGNTYDMHGFVLQGDSVLTDCKADCSPSTSDGYCVIAKGTGTKRIVGGEFVAGGSGSAFNNESGSTGLSLVGPRQNNDSFDLYSTSSGTQGTWYDTAGQLHYRGHQEWTEVASDPATPATGDWNIYFKSGGLYIRDDAGTVTGPLGTGGSGGGAWPDADKLMIGTTEYSTVSAAIAAATSGDLIKVGEGSFACNAQTLPDGVDMIGSGIGITVLTATTSATCLTVGDGCNVANLTAQSTYTGNYPYAISMAAGDSANFYRVRAQVVSTTTSSTVYAFNVKENSRLVQCEGLTDASSASGQNAIRAIGTAGSEIYVEGGWFSGEANDVSVASDTTVMFANPVLANGTISNSGTLKGIFSRDSAFTMIEQAADPSTPVTGGWRLYFKSGGLYVIDDGGTVTGPMGTGGGGGAPTDAEYLVLTANGTLTNERVMVAGDNLTGTDAGAGGNYTLDVDNPLNLPELGSDPTTPSTGEWKIYFKAGGLYIIDDTGTVTGPFIDDYTETGAPETAQYVTLATDATLTNERVLTGGNSITLTDGGAGSTITLDLDDVINVTEQGADPSTPTTGDWKLYTKSGGLYLIDDAAAVKGPFIDASDIPAAAPTDAQYVTLAVNGTLSDERVLVAGQNITATDGGAGGNVTLDLDDVLVQTEQGADPSTPSTGDWALYFKSGGLYHRDDAGSVVGPLGAAGADTQHFPAPDKCNIGATEYATFAAAIAAASSGDVILVGEGEHSCNNVTLPSGVHLVGVAPGLSVLSCSTNAVGLTVAGSNKIENLSINQIVTESTSVAKAVTLTGTGAWFYNCYIYSFNSGTQDNYGLHVSSTGGTPNVNWCYISANNGSSGDSYAVYIDQSSGKFRNCGIDGADYGVYCNAASSSPQFMQCSIDTTVTAANTVSWSGGSPVIGNFITTPGGGWGDGTMIFPSDGSLHMDEWSTDPATPKTNSWELYFKSGGLYIKDDTGAVTGPMGAGGGDEFFNWGW